MTSISNPSAHGSPVQIVAEEKIRAPLAADIAWSNHAQNPAVAGYALGNVAQIVTVPNAIVDRVGGQQNRR
jgi:hypothetical protein